MQKLKTLKEYEDDNRTIKEKFYYLVNKGRDETKLQSAAEKVTWKSK